MDRRGFLKTIFFTQLTIPLLLSSQSIKRGLQLYVIADSPQLFLPSLLRELQNYGLISGHAFTLLNSHPEERNIKRILAQKGWSFVSKYPQASLSLSFSLLLQQAFPSFTLIKNGRVWDIRSKRLYSLWKEMFNYHSPSFWLTTVSFKSERIDPSPGSFVSLYLDGQKVEKLSLKYDFFKSFKKKKGNISVVFENGKAWVSESSCPHKICLFSPPVSLAGERIICAPNHFLLEVQRSHSIDTIIG